MMEDEKLYAVFCYNELQNRYKCVSEIFKDRTDCEIAYLDIQRVARLAEPESYNWYTIVEIEVPKFS